MCRRFFALLVTSSLWAVMALTPAGSPSAQAAGPALDKMPAELSGVKVQPRFIPLEEKAVGWVQKVVGRAVALHQQLGQAYLAAKGNQAYRQDVFFTLADSRCVIKFTSQDLIALGAQTRLSILEYLDDPSRGEKKTVTKLLKGKALFYVLPLLKYKNRSFRVETPNAVAGVRGTKFGVEVLPAATTQAGLPLLLADASGRTPLRLAAAAGGGVLTRIYSFQGSVRITSILDGASHMLASGQYVDIGPHGMGMPRFMPPGMVNRFLGGVLPGGGMGGQGWQGSRRRRRQPPSPPGNPGEDNAHRDLSGNDRSGDISRTLTGRTIINTQYNSGGGGGGDGDGGGGGGGDNPEPTPTPTPSPSPSPQPSDNLSGKGYFTMLLKNNAGTLARMWASSEVQNFGGSSTYAHAVARSGWLRAASGFTYLTTARINSTVSLDSTDYDIDVHRIGGNSTLEWGWWESAEKNITDGTTTYTMLDRGYYVSGSPTSNMLSSGNYSYSGTAGGRFFDGTDLSGNVSCVVSFSNSVLTNFDLQVSNGTTGAGQRSVTIDDGNGTLNGSSFSVDLTSATTAKLNKDGTDYPIDSYRIQGSFYGSSAAKMGGVWAVANHADTTASAQGYFQASKGQSYNLIGKGYFSILLGTTDGLAHKMWVSSGIQNFSAGDTTADAVGTAGPLTAVKGLNYLKSAQLSSTVNLGSPNYDVTVHKDGSNSAMEWGWWESATQTIDDGGTNYYLMARGHYVTGNPTENMPTSGTYNYTGTTSGTFIDGTNGTPISGTVSCTVNFATNSLSNFQLDASNGTTGVGQRSVSFTSGSATLSGAQFTVTGITGSLNLDGTPHTIDTSRITGSFYGNTAKYMGGVWAVEDSTDKSAAASGYFRASHP